MWFGAQIGQPFWTGHPRLGPGSRRAATFNRMSEDSDRYERVSAAFTRRVEACPSDRWSSASPCEGWAARDVAVHVIETHRRVLAGLDGGAPAPVSPDADVATLWDDARGSVLAALADPARASQAVGGRFGEMTFEQLAGRMLSSDTLVHTWDLSRATGQDERLDPDGVEATLAWTTPVEDQLRVPGGFDPELEPPPGADAQTRLLGFLGRRV
jgi:uncharacterized protein (TIGR03086 family)